jgi:taurine transport system permease protein
VATLEGAGDMPDRDEPSAESLSVERILPIEAVLHDGEARPRKGASLWTRGRDPLIRLVFVLVVLVIWWLIAYLELVKPVFIPAPRSVWDQLIKTSSIHDGIRGWSDYYLYEHLWWSIRRILQGSAVAILVGIPLGLLIGLSRPSRTVLDPPLTFIRSLPPLAYFSLLVIWFGIDETPKVVLLFLAALPPIVLATSDAVRNVSEDRVLALRTLGASRLQVVRHGVFPMVLPEVMTGIRVAVAFAFTTMVAAETINGMPGIGGMVRDAQRFNQTDVVILGIIIIGLCGIVLDGIIKMIDRVLVPWRGQL